MKTAKLNPSDGIPFLSLGKMFAIPVLKKKVKNGKEKLMKKVCRFNRAFPNCYEPHYDSEAKCKALLTKMKANFHNKNLASLS